MRRHSGSYSLMGLILLSIGMLIILLKCGGGGGGLTTAVSLDDVSTIPSMDLRNYDFSSGLTVSSGMRARAESYMPVGSFSMPGCQCNAEKQIAFHEGMILEKFLCYIRKSAAVAEKSSLIVPGTFIRKEDWSYYRLMPPEMQKEISGGTSTAAGYNPSMKAAKEVLLRIGRFNGALKMDTCIIMPDETEYFPNAHYEYSLDSEVLKGLAVQRNRISYPGADTYQEDRSRFTIRINGYKSEQDFTSASFVSEIKMLWGSGRMSFSADGSSKSNSFESRFGGGWKDPMTGFQSTNCNMVLCEFGADLLGSTGWSGSNTYPAYNNECWVSDPEDQIDYGHFDPAVDGACTWSDYQAESFSIGGTADKPTFTVISDSNSPYWGSVSKALESFSESCSLETVSIDFNEPWNCEAANGNFIEISMQNGASKEMALECETYNTMNSYANCWNDQATIAAAAGE